MPFTASPEIHLRLLGGFDVVILGVSRAREFSYAKVKLLLAVLALAQGRALGRAELAEMLWPDTPDGRNNLRHALSVLRNLLREVPTALCIEGDQISLTSADVAVDVLAFLELDGSLSRDPADHLSWYRGPLLESLRFPASGVLEAWRQGWDVRIEQQLAQYRNSLLDTWCVQGRIQDALREVRIWVSMWPEDESVHRNLIGLYVAGKNYEAATRAFDYCALVLRERLGVEPAAQTRALLAAVPRIPVAANVVQAADAGLGRRPVAILGLVISSDCEDPEDASALLALACSQIREFAQGVDAWTALNFDNTMLVCFGYPSPEEQPARRAMAFAYRLQRQPPPESIRLAIGAHVGLTVVGGDGAPDAGAVVSQVAMQLAWMARRGEVLLTPQMAARISTDFAVVTERRHDRPLAILGAALSPRAPSRVFGRLPEFEELTRLWAALPGYRKPKGFLLRGEPGIGKSFLADLLAEHVAQAGGCVTRLRCDGLHAAHVPWGPVRAWLLDALEAAGIRLSCGEARAASEAAVSDWLQQHAGLAPNRAEVVSALLHPQRSLHGTDQMPASNTRGGSLVETLPAVVLHRARPYQPMLLVIEDLHWADGPMLDLIGAMLNRDEIGPVLILMTARDELQTPWPIDGRELRALDAGAIGDLVAYRSRGRSLPRTLREDIVRRSNGIPLYAEELVRQALLDNDARLPESVADLVVARVAQLDPMARRLAQLISVADEGVRPEFLTRCLNIPALALQPLLTQLNRHGLATDLSSRAFRHALIADAVYQTMSRVDRQASHRLVAEQLMADNGQIDPSRIAHHLDAAADPRCAAWWVSAACAALAGAVPLKDVAVLAKFALAALTFIVDPQHARMVELQSRLVLGLTYAEMLGGASPQAREAYDRAAEICDGSDVNLLFLSLWGKWLIVQASQPHADAVALAKHLSQIADAIGHAYFRGWALYAQGLGYLHVGDAAKAERYLRDAMRCLPTARLPDIAGLHYPGPTAVNIIRGGLGWAVLLQGRVEEADELARDAVERAMRVNEPFDQLASVMMQTRLHRLHGDLAGVEQSSRQLVDLAGKYAMPFWATLGEASLGWLAAQRGQDGGLSAMRAAISACVQAHPTLQTEYMLMLAEALLALGRPADALAELDLAQLAAERYGSVVKIGRISLMRGGIHAALGEPELAHTHWQAAVALGRRTGLSWLATRASACLRGRGDKLAEFSAAAK